MDSINIFFLKLSRELFFPNGNVFAGGESNRFEFCSYVERSFMLLVGNIVNTECVFNVLQGLQETFPLLS